MLLVAVCLMFITLSGCGTANAMSELNKQETASSDLLAQYSTPSVSFVDEELARLKAKLDGQD